MSWSCRACLSKSARIVVGGVVRPVFGVAEDFTFDVLPLSLPLIDEHIHRTRSPEFSYRRIFYAPRLVAWIPAFEATFVGALLLCGIRRPTLSEKRKIVKGNKNERAHLNAAV